MDRRNFIGLSLASVGTAMVSTSAAWAESSKQLMAAGNIYYTKDAPGRWSSKVATHLPIIEINQSSGKTTVKIVTPHEMKGYEHYIVKHVLLDKNYQFIDEKLFDPNKDKAAISTFVLENYQGALYALSLCNKHDLWLNSASA